MFHALRGSPGPLKKSSGQMRIDVQAQVHDEHTTLLPASAISMNKKTPFGIINSSGAYFAVNNDVSNSSCTRWEAPSTIDTATSGNSSNNDNSHASTKSYSHRSNMTSSCTRSGKCYQSIALPNTAPTIYNNWSGVAYYNGQAVVRHTSTDLRGLLFPRLHRDSWAEGWK